MYKHNVAKRITFTTKVQHNSVNPNRTGQTRAKLSNIPDYQRAPTLIQSLQVIFVTVPIPVL